MHCKVCSVPEARESQFKDILSKSEARWLRFGDVYFVCQKGEWPLPATLPDSVDLQSRVLFPEVSARSLHLITQRGCTVQNWCADVTILFDRGRHLVVSLSASQVREMRRKHPDMGIDPITQNLTVVEICPCPKEVERRPEIEDLVERISRLSIAGFLTTLTSYPTRRSVTLSFRQAANWARDVFASMGYDTELMDFRVPGKGSHPDGRSQNVVARKNALADNEQRIVLVVAHLDSINDNADSEDIDAPAPGADDNASGSAGVLEIARVFKDVEVEHELRLVLFGGEERGLFGSEAYVSRLSASEISRVDAVLNMDMIGSVNPGSRGRGVLLESKPFALDLINRLKDAAHAYAELRVETSLNPYASDHIPFLREGMPAILTIEGSDAANPRYHTEHDTLDHLDFELARQIVRMNAAVVAARIGIVG